MPLQHQTKKTPKANEIAQSQATKSSTNQTVGSEAGMTAAHILQLQRTVGNQAVQRMLAGAKSNQPTQALQRAEIPEEELQMKADHNNPIQKAGVDDEELQMKVDPNNPIQKSGVDDEELQMKAAPGNSPAQLKGKMPEDVQTKMESAFNSDFSDVNIHEGSKASEVGALAYAQGSDIHFAPGQYDPSSESGQQLLGHELTHVVQQRAGVVKPTLQANGIAINDDPSLENEADQMGKKAAKQPNISL